jgi:hypothetical protein
MVKDKRPLYVYSEGQVIARQIYDNSDPSLKPHDDATTQSGSGSGSGSVDDLTVESDEDDDEDDDSESDDESEYDDNEYEDDDEGPIESASLQSSLVSSTVTDKLSKHPSIKSVVDAEKEAAEKSNGLFQFMKWTGR